MGGKTREHLLNELPDFGKTPEKTAELPDQRIGNPQMPCTIEKLYPQVVDFFPYPIAIFTPQHTLVIVNKAFKAETNIKLTDSGTVCARFLRYKTGNIQLSDVLELVFEGKTFYLEGLINPLSMISGIGRQKVPQPDRFKRAVVFPVFLDNCCVSHGVIMLLP